MKISSLKNRCGGSGHNNGKPGNRAQVPMKRVLKKLKPSEAYIRAPNPFPMKRVLKSRA
jgi:hypothetical protein